MPGTRSLAARGSGQVPAPRCAARGCSCSGSPTVGAAEAAAELSAWAALLRAAPWLSAPPGGQELRPGAPRGPCCCGRRGGGSSLGRRGARETPQKPRALAPCDPPRLLPSLGLYSLLAEPPAVATAEGEWHRGGGGGGGTRESSVRTDSAAPPPPRAGGSRVPQPYHAPGANRALGETETPEPVGAILWLLR